MKRRRLGQHYLVDEGLAKRMVAYAEIGPDERILEIGTGRGALTRHLVGLGRRLDTYEVDPENYEATKDRFACSAVGLHLGDGFAEQRKFDVMVSSLPYSESSTFVEWLAGSSYRRAVVLLQDDFVRKLVAAPGTRDYRGVSALAQVSSSITIAEKVRRMSFDPPPRVGSAVAIFEPKVMVSEAEVSNVARLFSLRRRQVGSVLKELGMRAPRKSYGMKRVYSLSPAEVHEICSA